MVVSEIGDIWSPHTAPERIAATFIVIRGLASPKIAIAIGINIPNVPHDVPVANERPSETRKKIAGSKIPTVAFPPITELTKPPIFKKSSLQIPESVHARQRIITAGVIALNPFTKHSQNSVNLMIFLGIYNKNVNINAINDPITRLLAEAQFANASITVTPSKIPPV